jgi:ComF family protein
MLKYGKKVHAAFHMAEMIRDRLRDSGMEAFDLIVPVPLHESRERERGFNQAFLLAEALGKMRGEPVCKDAIYMKKPTIDQTRLGRQGRFKNLKGSFNTRNGINLNGKRILLIDDVLTTGATADDCARALKEAGAEAVVAATVACS